MSRLDDLITELCPDGVEFKELGEVSKISRGASPRPISRYITEDVEGIPWVKIGDTLKNSKYIIQTKEKITTEGSKKSKFIKKGDFILSNSMSFGRPYIMGIDGCIHDGWLSISGFEKTYSANFLYYLISSSFLQQTMASKVSEGTIRNLNVDIVKK